MITLLKMSEVLYPQYHQAWIELQEECEHYAHQIKGVTLNEAVMIMSESPVMLERHSEIERDFIEDILMEQLSSQTVH